MLLRASGWCAVMKRGRMKIHEYQGKEILREFGVPTPRGSACFSVEEAVAAAQQLGGKVWVVKAQIHAGGRGKGGGVIVVGPAIEARPTHRLILGVGKFDRLALGGVTFPDAPRLHGHSDGDAALHAVAALQLA